MKESKLFVKGINEIVSRYVDDVAMEMLNEAKILMHSEWFENLVIEFAKRYEEEEKTYINNIDIFLMDGCSLDASQLKPSCLTHSNAYRQVIADILQKRTY